MGIIKFEDDDIIRIKCVNNHNNIYNQGEQFIKDQHINNQLKCDI